MPIALLVEIIQALMALAPQIPKVLALGESAIGIAQTGTVTPEQEAAIQADLDEVKSEIDAASP